MAEENVEQARIPPVENPSQLAQLPGRDLPGRIANLAKPEAAQEVKSRPRNDVDLIDRKPGGILPFLRNHQRPEPLQAGNLPVDVEHLRF